MKKTMITLAIAGLCAMSSGAFAATDSANAVVTWKGTVPGVLPGNTITITGLGGGDIPPGQLSVLDDGTFASSASVILESHSFDDTKPESEKVGDLIQATWKLKGVSVTPASYNVEDVKVSFNHTELAVGADLGELHDTISVDVRNDVANDQVIPSQSIEVTTIAVASVEVA
ncbi:hypothetical protein EQ875_01425 [Photobacterium damselae subsp. damselae]|uniref:hypothetical protein n=1 Tax=Photobacterium damselae TaxID=38293 RepID=UPI000D0599AA|nr:hypothetical protein [Photobacterium damselae]PSB78532.1 hypothetical protein C5F62_17735 [Photobacterium damselae subsp. damselae]TGZ35146.1 hypothetical protein EQ875_01425 [Photobacterium damselae subsp. damselae]